MAALQKSLIAILLLAAYSSGEEFHGIPPTIVNGLRCYWKYTCFIPTQYSIDVACNLYVPQRFCENVQIQLQPNNQIQPTTEKTTTSTMITPQLDKSPESVQKPNTFTIIEAPVNCPDNQMPDHNGNCKLVFSRGA